MSRRPMIGAPALPGPVRGTGFTLIEMMTVLAVLVILITIALPSFSELTASQRVQTASADLYTSLIRARSEAIKQNLDVTVSPSGTWAGGWVVSSVAGNLEAHGATKDIAIDSGAASVIYRSNGRLAPGDAPEFSFSATSTSTKRCVKFLLSGQPVVKKAACA